MSGDYIELSGDDLRRWMEAPPMAKCNRCGRKTWDEDELHREDRMTQPDGNPCGGRFVAVSDD